MKLTLGLCAIGLACATSPAFAAPDGITYDCDTAADHYSELVLPAGSGPFTVSGNVRLNAIAASKTYTPFVRIQITSPGDPGQAPSSFAGFSLSALPMGAKKTKSGAEIVQVLSYNANDKSDEILPLSMMTKPGTIQPFNLSYDGSDVAVKLGGDTKTFPLKVADPVVRIVCSTGEFLLTDLKITPAR